MLKGGLRRVNTVHGGQRISRHLMMRRTFDKTGGFCKGLISAMVMNQTLYVGPVSCSERGGVR
jgi:hypothetical protein